MGVCIESKSSNFISWHTDLKVNIQEAILYVKNYAPNKSIKSSLEFQFYHYYGVWGVSNERCKHTCSFVKFSLEPTLKSRAEEIFRTKLLH